MRTSNVLKSMTAAVALLALPGALLAQDIDAEGFDEEPVTTGMPTTDLEARAGVAVPAGDLAKFTDTGVSVGLGGAFWLHDNVAVRADGTFAGLNGERHGLVTDAVTPDVSLYHYGVGVELDVPGRASPSPWDFEVNAGVGATTLDTENFIETDGLREDITRTYPNVNAGVSLGHQLAENFVISLQGQAFYTFVDEAQLEPISDLRARDNLERGVSVPVTFSIRWDLPSGPATGMAN